METLKHPLEQLSLSGEELLDSYQDNVPTTRTPTAFHNAKAIVVLQTEKPWHRYALHLAARAKMSAVDIAQVLQVSPASVRTLFRQEWFQKQYDTLVSSRADTLYEQLMEGEDVNSLLTLIELRDNPNVKAPTRAACAFDILDRMKGKAIQRSMSVSTTLQSKQDIDALKAEYALLEAEEQELLGASAKQPQPNANGVIRPTQPK